MEVLTAVTGTGNAAGSRGRASADFRGGREEGESIFSEYQEVRKPSRRCVPSSELVTRSHSAIGVTLRSGTWPTDFSPPSLYPGMLPGPLRSFP